jgi:hypothetical protein
MWKFSYASARKDESDFMVTATWALDTAYFVDNCIVKWRLKAGIVEPEQTSIAKQRCGNYFHAATNSNERVHCWTMAVSNTSTVAQRVVGGHEKEVSNLRVYNKVASPTGLGPENDCSGEDQ